VKRAEYVAPRSFRHRTDIRITAMTTTHYSTRTDAKRETVLCLHASAGTGRAWRSLATSLAASVAPRFEVLTPDRLGCGVDASWVPGAPASCAAEVRHLAPILDARPDGVHLVGHSYGGAVALEIALRRPHQVKSLTLYEPVRFSWLFGLPDMANESAEVLKLGRAVALWALSGRCMDAAEMFIDYWSGAGTWGAMDLRRRQGIAACMPKVAAEFEAAFMDPTPIDAVNALAMPVCLLSGDASPLPVRRIMARLIRQLPRAEAATLAGIGHMGPVTHPDRFESHLPPWLRAPALAFSD
jgi:pimeloyl-ACP methyl ester carboxylesterase